MTHLKVNTGGHEARAPLVRWGFGLGLMLASIGAFWLIGPIHAIRGSTKLEELTPLVYLFPIFLPVGMLVADVLLLFSTGDRRRGVALGLGFLGLVLLGAARFAFLVPLSGHAVVLGFFLLWYARRRSVGPLIVGGVLLVQVAYYKLAVWHDPLTLGLGLVAGAALGGLQALAVGVGRTSLRDPTWQ